MYRNSNDSKMVTRELIAMTLESLDDGESCASSWTQQYQQNTPAIQTNPSLSSNPQSLPQQQSSSSPTTGTSPTTSTTINCHKMEPLPYAHQQQLLQQQQRTLSRSSQQSHHSHHSHSSHSHSDQQTPQQSLHSYSSQHQHQHQHHQHQHQHQNHQHQNHQQQSLGTSHHPYQAPLSQQHTHTLIAGGELERGDSSLAVGGSGGKGRNNNSRTNNASPNVSNRATSSTSINNGPSSSISTSGAPGMLHQQQQQQQQQTQYPFMYSPPRVHRNIMSAYDPYQQYTNSNNISNSNTNEVADNMSTNVYNTRTPQHSQHHQHLLPPSQRTPSLLHSPAAAHFHSTFSFRGGAGMAGISENDQIELGSAVIPNEADAGPGGVDNEVGMDKSSNAGIDIAIADPNSKSNSRGKNRSTGERISAKKMRMNNTSLFSASASQSATSLTPLFDSTTGMNRANAIELDDLPLPQQHQHLHQHHHHQSDRQQQFIPSRHRTAGSKSRATDWGNRRKEDSFTSSRMTHKNMSSKTSSTSLPSQLSPKNDSNNSSKSSRKNSSNSVVTDSSSKDMDSNIQSLKKEILDLQEYVDELKYSESVEIGTLQQQLRKAKNSESLLRKNNEFEFKEINKDFEDAMIAELMRLEKIERIIFSILKTPSLRNQAIQHSSIQPFRSNSNFGSDAVSLSQSVNEYESTKSDNAYHGDNDDDEADNDDEKSLFNENTNMNHLRNQNQRSNKNIGESSPTTEGKKRRGYVRLRQLLTNKGKKVQQYLLRLQSFVQELKSSESVEIGDLKMTIRRLRDGESHRSAKLQQEVNYLRREVVTQSSNNPSSNNVGLNTSTVEDQHDQDSTQSNDQYKHHIDSTSSNALAVRGGAEGGTQGSDMTSLPPVSNSHDQENIDLRREIQQLKGHIEELSSSESVEIGGLKNTIAILRRNENKTVKDLEDRIEYLKNLLLQDRNACSDGQGQAVDEDLLTENKRLRMALVEKYSFDSNDLELFKSSSTGSRNMNDSSSQSETDIQVRKNLPSQEEEENAMMNLKLSLCEKDDIIKSLRKELEKVRSANTSEESSNQQKSRFDQSTRTHHERVTGVARDNTDKPKSQTRNSVLDNRNKSKGPMKTSVESETLVTKSARPPLGALKLKDGNEMTDENQKLHREIDVLKNDLNKWRIKATLLVEKKNKVRLLAKENTKLKEKVEKLKDKLKSCDGYISPIPSPAAKVCPTTRCTV